MGAPPARRGRTLEVIAALVLGGAVLAYFQIPHLWATRADRLGQHPGWVYFGGLHTYSDEAAVYMAWMRQARDGNLFFTDLYTPEPHPRNFVNVLMWSFGTVARWTGLSLVQVYSHARIVFGVLLIVLLHALAGRLFARPGERFACFLTMLIAGGWEGPAAFMERHFGWAHVSSPGWWMPEISTPFSMMLFSQFLAGFCAMVGAVILLLRAWEPQDSPRGSSVRDACGAGAIMAVLTFFHPYDVVPLVATAGLAPLLFGLAERRIPWREIRIALLALAVWLPAFLYNLLVFTTNPAMRSWDLQNLMPTPEFSKVILSLGVGGPLSLLGMIAAFRAGRRHLVMLAWLLSTLVIIYLPLRFQRRCMGGIQYPMAALAVGGLAFIVVPLAAKLVARHRAGTPVRPGALPFFPGIGTLGIVLLLLPLQALTPIYVQAIEWSRLRAVEEPAWVREEIAAALRWLEQGAASGSVVLASYPVGNIVPPLTGLHCFVGHYALTMDARAKEADVERFYAAAPEDDPWRVDLLERFSVDYVLDTSFERRLGDFEPSARPWLERVYSAGDSPEHRVAVYAVRPHLRPTDPAPRSR